MYKHLLTMKYRKKFLYFHGVIFIASGQNGKWMRRPRSPTGNEGTHWFNDSIQLKQNTIEIYTR